MTELLREYLATYEVAPVFTEEEILHYLNPVEGVIETHVVEGKGKVPHLRTAEAHGACAIQTLPLSAPSPWQLTCRSMRGKRGEDHSRHTAAAGFMSALPEAAA